MWPKAGNTLQSEILSRILSFALYLIWKFFRGYKIGWIEKILQALINTKLKIKI